jgi:hypothetical protein
MTPYHSRASFAILKICCSKGEKESVFLPFWILFLFIEEIFLSDQECLRCIHGLADAQVKWKCAGLLLLEFDGS